MGKKKKNESIARGYRLKPGTHRLIKQVKDDLGISHDKILSEAIRLFYIELKKSGKKLFNQIKNF